MIGASKVFEYPTTLYGYLPHSHLRGLDAKYTAYYPDGTEEVLLNIPAYDWNWQANYTYKEPKQIPAGTRVDVLMTYVNTEGAERGHGAGTRHHPRHPLRRPDHRRDDDRFHRLLGGSR